MGGRCRPQGSSSSAPPTDFFDFFCHTENIEGRRRSRALLTSPARAATSRCGARPHAPSCPAAAARAAPGRASPTGGGVGCGCGCVWGACFEGVGVGPGRGLLGCSTAELSLESSPSEWLRPVLGINGRSWRVGRWMGAGGVEWGGWGGYRLYHAGRRDISGTTHLAWHKCAPGARWGAGKLN